MEPSKVVFVKNSRPKKSKNSKKKKKTTTVNRFSYLPLSYRVRLRTRTYETGTTVSSPNYFRYGLLEPLSIAPMFQTQLFSLYKRARIHCSSITLRLHNLGSEPLEMVVATLPHSYTTGTPDLSEVVDKPGAKRVTLSGAGGMDRALLTKSVSSKQVLGHDWALSDYDFNVTQAASTTPIASDEPVWLLVLSAFNSSASVSYRLEVVIEWDYEFYDQDSAI
jgi:hypothetical protein